MFWDSTNVEHRYWASSRPVIHLAAPIAIVGQWVKEAGQVVGLESFLFQQVLIDLVLRHAEELKSLIAQDPTFLVNAEQLIPFRVG